MLITESEELKSLPILATTLVPTAAPGTGLQTYPTWSQSDENHDEQTNSTFWPTTLRTTWGKAAHRVCYPFPVSRLRVETGSLYSFTRLRKAEHSSVSAVHMGSSTGRASSDLFERLPTSSVCSSHNFMVPAFIPGVLGHSPSSWQIDNELALVHNPKRAAYRHVIILAITIYGGPRRRANVPDATSCGEGRAK